MAQMTAIQMKWRDAEHTAAQCLKTTIPAIYMSNVMMMVMVIMI